MGNRVKNIENKCTEYFNSILANVNGNQDRYSNLMTVCSKFYDEFKGLEQKLEKKFNYLD